MKVYICFKSWSEDYESFEILRTVYSSEGAAEEYCQLMMRGERELYPDEENYSYWFYKEYEVEGA